MSETAQNVLNTMLFHTGDQSSKFMLVLATNRPHELDEALLDRMDEIIQVRNNSNAESSMVRGAISALETWKCTS